MIWFLDTNTCIYLLQGKFPSIREKILSKKPADIKIPAMVVAELYVGVEITGEKDFDKNVAQFIGQFEVVDFNHKCAKQFSMIRAAMTRKETNVGPYDLIIAATVMANAGILVTNNEKEFARIKGLSVENWVNKA